MREEIREISAARLRRARRLLLFWTLFIGLGAVAGAAGMLLDPSGKAMGMDAMLPYFQVLPLADLLFRDLFFSGCALLVVNGLTNLTAAALLLAHKRSGLVLGGLFGVTLMLWICIQFYMFPFNFMSTAYFIFGLCQAVTGYAASVYDRQLAFGSVKNDYPHIGSDPRRLVVYYSRMGYAERIAMEEAERSGACLYELKTTEKTDGFGGFLWCGRYGMLRREMPIEPPDIDLSGFEHITLCSAIWVFSLAAPMRSFCRQAAGQLREADLILLHHTKGQYGKAREEAERLLNLRMTSFRSLCCRHGVMKTT